MERIQEGQRVTGGNTILRLQDLSYNTTHDGSV